MNKSLSRRLVPGLLLCGLGLAALPAQAQYLELYTNDSTSFEATPGGTATVNYTLRLMGLQSASLDPQSPDVLSAYDIGIIYNPAFLTLQSFAFDALNLLGNPTEVDVDSFPLVIQQDPWDNVNDPPGIGTYQSADAANSTWDWRDNSNVVSAPPTVATYTPDAAHLGTPTITAPYQINEGSLRIAAVSFLDLAALQALQGGVNNDVTPLFTVSFLVKLDHAGRTPINIVYSTDYSGATGNELDLKYSLGDTAQYPTRVNGEIVVAVPLPGSLLLMLPGLLLLWRRRTV